MQEAASGLVKASPAKTQPGFVGQIPVRNLWLLMLYASDLFRMMGTDRIQLEQMPDHLPDIVAEILAHAVEQRLRRNLSLGYQPRRAILDRVRGRIDLLATESRQLLKRGKVACRYEELTIDTPRNRYVCGALDSIAPLVKFQDVAHQCRKLARDLRSLGVTGIVPTREQMSADRFSRHDANDQFMVAAAKLAFDLKLPTEDTGEYVLAMPDRDEYWVRRLFERAVYGFYNVTLSSAQWRVSKGTVLKWQIEAQTPRIENILPTMKTDIILEHPASARKIVIDTKFTQLLVEGQYREESLRSSYIFQIYAYLRSQVDRGAERGITDGLLLHPSVGEDIDEAVRIQGHLLRFATVDLTADSQNIRTGLLRVAQEMPASLVTVSTS